MFISTVILWLGRRLYVDVPPAPPTRTRSPGHQDALVARGPNGSGRPGLALALFGGLVALVCVVLGFVDLGRMLILDAKPLLGVAQWWCLALVVAIGFAGVGAWRQLDRATRLAPR